MLEQYKDHAKAAQMPIGSVDYQFIEPFQIVGKDNIEISNGKVIRIDKDGKRCCQFTGSKRWYKRSLERLKELSSYNPCNEDQQVDSDEDSSENDDEQSDIEEEIPYSKPPKPQLITSGRFFKDLVRKSLDELQNYLTAR